MGAIIYEGRKILGTLTDIVVLLDNQQNNHAANSWNAITRHINTGDKSAFTLINHVCQAIAPMGNYHWLSDIGPTCHYDVIDFVFVAKR